MSQQVISEKTKNSLEALKSLLSNFYLAGGTGLAFQIKHRFSEDLDFFTQEEFSPDKLIQKIKQLGNFSVEKTEELTLIGAFNQVRVSFLGYEYPLLRPLKDIKGIKVADIADIGCMKLTAISSRATKKDFIDLYFILNQISLKELFILFQTKYAEIDFNQAHILKSLSYFEEAEKDSMPKMIAPVSWEEVKKRLQCLVI